MFGGNSTALLAKLLYLSDCCELELVRQTILISSKEN